MNIENLEVGKVYKNYKALCEVLGEKPVTSNSKKAQIKEWERYFSYIKDGNKIIIKEVYDTVHNKIDNRGGNNKLAHAQRMDDTLTYIINKQDDGQLLMTMTKLLKEMKMINSNFIFGNRHKKKVSVYLDIEEAYIEEFFNTSKRTFKSNIESMLDRLEGKSMVYWSKVKTVCIARSTTNKNSLDEVKVNAEIVVDEFDNEHIELSTDTSETLEYRIATDEEVELIMGIEDYVMEQILNCKDKQEIVVKDKWSIFKKHVNKLLLEEANILYYYDSYKIIRNKNKLSRIANQIELNEDDIIQSLNLLDLNSDVQKQLLTNWERRQHKAIVNDEAKKGNKFRLRTTDAYMENGSILISNFINTKHNYIVDDLKYTKVTY